MAVHPSDARRSGRPTSPMNSVSPVRTAKGCCRVLSEIEHQDRDRLDGVAGSLEHLHAQSREVERIAVLHGDEGVFGLGAGAEMDGRAATVAQLQVAGDEVGVEVAEKDMANL